MKKSTAVRLIVEIKANYRYTYRDMTEEEMRILSERWYECLLPYTDEQVERAFRAALCKCAYSPTIADIIGIIQRQCGKNNDLALWQTLKRAVGEICQTAWDARRGFIAIWEMRGASAKSVYDRLPAEVRECVDFESFCDMGGMSEKELGFERARFLKALPEKREENFEKFCGLTVDEKRKFQEENMNKVILIGNLTRDPELTQTAGGVSVCRFTVAVQRNYKNEDGEREADFFNVTAWRGLADSVARFTKKGNKVAVSGSIQMRNYEDNQGVKRMAVDILASEVDFLTPKAQESAPEPKKKPTLQSFEDDGDIPF